jgi:hypothetical protein
VAKIYGARGWLAVPITFTANRVTLGHILNLFKPSSEMKDHTAILGTVQLILSQLREPFDLQSKSYASWFLLRQ